jgi:D-citramalate synthase
MPERFGRQRKYALGKTSGKANIENNLLQFGIHLSDQDLKKVTQRIIELGDRKEIVTQADLPYIISDVLDSNAMEQKVRIENYVLTHSKDLNPSVTLKISVNGELFEEHSQAMASMMHL